MAKVLYIKASPRTGRSYSVSVADAFIESYRSKNPNDEVITIDLFKKNLAAFDETAVSAKYSIMHGKKHSDEELSAWSHVESVIDEFKSADKYVFAVPMWNFGIPYRLKQYMDVIIQPGYTFTYSAEEGYKGLLGGRPVFVSYARGGEYPENTESASYDFQKRYMDLVLGFMGLNDVKFVVVEPTMQAGPEVAALKKEEAIVKAKGIAQNF